MNLHLSLLYLLPLIILKGRFDLIPKIRDNRVEAFANEFEIIKVEDLPQPEIDCRIANKICLK
jgi:hypothetical protein